MIPPEGDGRGTVISNDGRIDCGNDCSEAYSRGGLEVTEVAVTAAPDAESFFDGWGFSDDVCRGFAASCTVPMDFGRERTPSFGVRPPAGQLYFSLSQDNGYEVRRMPLDGSSDPEGFGAAGRGLATVELDAARGLVYWQHDSYLRHTSLTGRTEEAIGKRPNPSSAYRATSSECRAQRSPK